MSQPAFVIPLTLLPLVTFALLLALGCDRNIEPYVEGEEPRTPDLARIFPDSEKDRGRVSRGMESGAAPAVRRNLPPSRTDRPDRTGSPPGPLADAAGAAGESIRGVVSLGADVAYGAPRGGVLFVIARHPGGAGPPLAVYRVADPSFPIEYSIGPENVMIPSMQFAGEIELSARLDSDGNAMTRLPGDLQGGAAGTLSPGATDIQIVLDERL